jgi:hypothetical protein
MKRLAFVTSNVLSRPTADIIYIMEMCNAFAKKGLDTILYVPRFDVSKRPCSNNAG